LPAFAKPTAALEIEGNGRPEVALWRRDVDHEEVARERALVDPIQPEVGALGERARKRELLVLEREHGDDLCAGSAQVETSHQHADGISARERSARELQDDRQ